jgi:methylmalonyl-CoA mutase
MLARNLRRKCSTRSYPPEWRKLAQKETGQSPEHLEWTSPEGIIVKPLYTSSDGEAEVPGVYPFKRGPYATMYTSKP